MTAPLVHYFLNSLWQLPLLALCTWLALRIARPGSRVHYVLWIATLLLALLLPLRGISLATTQVAVDSSALDFTGPLPPLAVHHSLLPSFTITVSPRVCILLASLYLALTFFCILRLVLAHLAIRRLIAASVPWHSPVPQLPAGCPVLTLPSSHTAPLVAGILRPVILLPITLRDASPQQLQTVFAHEHAHILRRDLLVNAVLRVLTLPIAYHPAAAWMHSQVRRTRELLVDSLAAETLSSPTLYANSLLALSTRLVHAGTPLTAGLFDHPFRSNSSQQIASRKILEERIMHLIAPPPASRPLVRAVRIFAGTLILSAAAATASFIHLSPSVLAAQQPAPAAQPASPVEPVPASPAVEVPAIIQPVPAIQPVPSIQPVLAVPDATLPAPTPAPAAAAVPPGSHPLTPEERRQLEDRVRAATDQVRKATAHIGDQFNTPAFQEQLRRQTEQATRNPIDPATQARIDQLSKEISKSAVNSPEFRKSIEELRRQVESPEFKQHIRELTEQARKNAMTADAQRKLNEDIKRQLNTPEFKQQLAQLRADSLRLRLDALPPTQPLAPLTPADPPTAPAAHLAPQAPSPDAPARVSGGVMAGQRESGTNPTYPPDAKAARIQGAVVLHAIISKEGTIESLQTISGPPELQQAAWDAVKTWVYKPYLLNGQPTVVETTITVTFSFAP